MRVLVCGGRELLDPDFTWNKDSVRLALELAGHLARAKEKYGEALVVVHGGADGGDRIGEMVARHLGITTEKHPANWKAHGRRAGYIRNTEMEKVSEVCLALPGGRGTDMMVGLMEDSSKPVAKLGAWLRD